MSTYVMSDIHGCYDELMEMLDIVHFSKGDFLVLAGDYIDRGPKSYEMLRWMEQVPENVLLLVGNHDKEFAVNVQLMRRTAERNGLELDENSAEHTALLYELVDRFSREQSDGISYFDYYGTLRGLLGKKVTLAELTQWEEMISRMPYYHKMHVGDRECVIVHAGYIESLEGIETDDIFENLEEFYLYARDDAYMYGGLPHGMVIAGHTPTIAEEELPYNDGAVYRFYDEELDCIFYDIDCGSAMRKAHPGGKLACIRLEDEKVYYH